VRAHRTDLVSLAFGLLFVGLAAWWLTARLLGFVLPPVGWFLAGALVLIGVLGLVGALRSARSPRPAEPGSTIGPDGTPGGTAPTSGHPVPEVAAWEAGRTDDADRWPGTGHPEWDVPAPVSGGPATGSGERDGADEWPTEAVADRRTEAVEDRPADVPGEAPPAPPGGDDRR
jgi:hypothetical protein